MDYSNPFLIQLRRLGQKLHILRPVVRLWRKIRGSAYEEAFDKYVVSRIPAGAVVWDVGANIGFFTEKFAVATGQTGTVVAFDPSPSCIAILQEKFSANDNVIVERVGLADFAGVEDFSLTEHADPTGGLGMREGHNDVVKVDITTGDIYVNEHIQRAPNYIKIDVEGYEYEAINGMTSVLRSENLKGLFIEIHFLELTKRNLADAPTKIVDLLKSNGFSIRWIDPSHLAAERL